ncbi:MAG: helicase-related protein [Candidatus Thorarchaeota archaeon]
MTAIQPNMKVRYAADPTVVGWVINVEGENARVFIDGSTKLVPLTELEPAPGLVQMTPHQFKVALTRRRLEHPLTEQLLSYKASKTQLFYHQFLPVKKLLESPDQRLLIADEVGTGKTIEAGLIWAELEARAPQGLENVWVICPKALMGKWQEEMLQRFDLRLELLSSEGLRQALVSLDRDGVLPPRFSKAVVNLELIRAEEHVTRLGNTSVAWDFVIFDEAHHLRNPETLSYALARFICERAKAAVYLTATPLQTSLEDIVHLMEALGVDIAADPYLLEEQVRWDMELNDWIRLLRRRPPGWEKELYQILDRLGENGGRERPGWDRLKELVSTCDLSDVKQRTTVVQAARDVQVLSPYMTRTLRSDIDMQRPTREAITRIVRFNQAEERFYQEVYRICLVRAQAAGVPPGFATQMPERRTASCVPAVAAEILKLATENEEEEHRVRFTREEIEALQPYARAVIGTLDSKFDALVQILGHVFKELRADRVMIFSTFRGTLHYLSERLRHEGYSLEVVHGGVPARDEDCRRGEKSRERIAAEFRRGDFQILLASEVAGEGLDFEHCHVVINYDLPWNPMRVEQRIGRCDRLGQKSEKIYIGNLASTGTIEERILSRLYHRLHIFERALGDMELILGEQIASFEREVFTLGLSAQQQEERLERIAQAIANLEQQRESIAESSAIFLAGRQLLESDQEEIKQAESRFLSPQDIGEFVHATLGTKFQNCIRKLPVGESYEVVGSKELRDALRGLLRAYPASHYSRTEIVRFIKRLEEGKVRIAFGGDTDQAEFAHIRHPLVLLARWLTREPLPDIPYCHGFVRGKVEHPTLLVWAVGSLEGYTNRAELLCATVDCNSGRVIPLSVEQAQELMALLVPVSQDSRFEELELESLMRKAERTLLAQFGELTAGFNARNTVLSQKAKHAVVSHSERKLNWLRRQLSRNDLKDNIRNLYRGWSQRIEAETRSKLEEIEQKSAVKSSLQVIGLVLLLPS